MYSKLTTGKFRPGDGFVEHKLLARSRARSPQCLPAVSRPTSADLEDLNKFLRDAIEP